MKQQSVLTSPQRIKSFQKKLLAWYRANHRKLPWRETNDPYRIWVSEVMLQQTQVSRVLDFYAEFLKRFPSLNTLAQADMQEVLKAWEKLGYYARVRNLHRAAKQMVQAFDSKVPDNYSDFRKLPGVGEYIAAAVMSQAFGQPYPVVDGNVKRVLARLLLLDMPVNHSGSMKQFREVSEKLLFRTNPGQFNQAVMELGATICRPQNPRCAQCPVAALCLANQKKQTGAFPKRIAAKNIPRYHVAVGVIHRDGEVLITRRKNDGLLGGLWEFPGGKVKKGESAQEACRREILEEVNLLVEVQEHLTRVNHAYTHFKIEMDVFRCDYCSGEVQLRGAVDYRWVKPAELAQFPFPAANHKFLHLVTTHE